MADYGVRITLAAASPVPTYTGGPWVSGVAKLSSSSGAVGWSSGILIEVSPVGETVDIASGGNYASVSDVDVVLFAQWVPDFETAGVSMYGATVEVGTLSGTTLTVRWTGVVSDLGWRGSELRITAESVITLRHREIPARILSGDEFAGLPADAEGRAVPILYGAVERLTPPSLQSDRDYLTAMIAYAGTNPEPIYRSTTMIAQPYGAAAPTSSTVPVVWIIQAGEPAATPDGSYVDDPWWLEPVGTVYMEIFSGSGAGQTRLVQTITAPAGSATIGENTISWVTIPLASPLDALPDETSGIRFYSQATGAVLVVGDEAETTSVVVDLDGKEYPIGFSAGSVNDVITADVSSEFRSGENYAAIRYQYPSNVFGVAAISDGISATGSSIAVMPLSFPAVDKKAAEIFCRFDVEALDLPDTILSEEATLYFVASVNCSGTAATGVGYMIQCIGTKWDGTEEIIAGSYNLPGTSLYYGNDESDVNGYNPSILPDGDPGAFSRFAVALSPALPIRSYSRIRCGLAWADSTKGVTNWYLENVTWTSGATSITLGASFGAGWAGAVDIVGKLVAPMALKDPPAGTAQEGYEEDRFTMRLEEFFGSVAADRRTVTTATWNGAAWVLGLDSSISVPTGVYFTTSMDAGELVTITEREAGILASYGTISTESQFIATVSQGRTFDTHWTTLPVGVSNGDPITEAAHVAQDVFLRDLAIPQADIGASYLTVPAYTARVALVEQEDSASVLARMCREFNWVGGHDNAGRETLVAWLESLYTASADYAVVNADIVEDSLDGVDATSLDDIVTLPRVSWDLTQADGYRGAGTVTDCSADPSTITPSNYLRTISGFGDYSTALSAYEVLHEAWKRNGVRRSESIEYRYGGNPTDLYLPERMAWVASRKDILQFKLNESHAASAAYVGQRISVTHKRYTGGGTVYGTLVARYWFPADGQIQLTVMLDPVAFAVDDLYVDTIDPTATIEQYTDETDGVSEQYTDTLGA